ncbi:MAG: hypothetical protein GX221_07165 [Candidatus Riflebacteria bacterium]|nr:hypothetical protein [Candidatus Riflebacteria bacterium]
MKRFNITICAGLFILISIYSAYAEVSLEELLRKLEAPQVDYSSALNEKQYEYPDLISPNSLYESESSTAPIIHQPASYSYSQGYYPQEQWYPLENSYTPKPVQNRYSANEPPFEVYEQPLQAKQEKKATKLPSKHEKKENTPDVTSKTLQPLPKNPQKISHTLISETPLKPEKSSNTVISAEPSMPFSDEINKVSQETPGQTFSQQHLPHFEEIKPYIQQTSAKSAEPAVSKVQQTTLQEHPETETPQLVKAEPKQSIPIESIEENLQSDIIEPSSHFEEQPPSQIIAYSPPDNDEFSVETFNEKQETFHYEEAEATIDSNSFSSEDSPLSPPASTADKTLYEPKVLKLEADMQPENKLQQDSNNPIQKKAAAAEEEEETALLEEESEDLYEEELEEIDPQPIKQRRKKTGFLKKNASRLLIMFITVLGAILAIAASRYFKKRQAESLQKPVSNLTATTPVISEKPQIKAQKPSIEPAVLEVNQNITSLKAHPATIIEVSTAITETSSLQTPEIAQTAHSPIHELDNKTSSLHVPETIEDAASLSQPALSSYQENADKLDTAKSPVSDNLEIFETPEITQTLEHNKTTENHKKQKITQKQKTYQETLPEPAPSTLLKPIRQKTPRNLNIEYVYETAETDASNYEDNVAEIIEIYDELPENMLSSGQKVEYVYEDIHINEDDPALADLLSSLI